MIFRNLLCAHTSITLPLYTFYNWSEWWPRRYCSYQKITERLLGYLYLWMKVHTKFEAFQYIYIVPLLYINSNKTMMILIMTLAYIPADQVQVWRVPRVFHLHQSLYRWGPVWCRCTQSYPLCCWPAAYSRIYASKT